MSDENKFVEALPYIILFIQILILIAMFLMIQQISNAVVDIKEFCWGDINQESGIPFNIT